MTVAEPQEAVAKLSREKLTDCRERFHGFEEDEWDRRIARHAEAGTLDKFAEEAIADYKAGRVNEL